MSVYICRCVAFVEFLNSKLGWDPKLKYLLPVSASAPGGRGWPRTANDGHGRP